MSKDAQDRILLTEDAKKKFEDCVASLAACGFGPDGPPIETTFAEIEEFGHEVGKMLARALDERLTDQHATHFQGTAACPCCNVMCPVSENPNTRNATSRINRADMWLSQIEDELCEISLHRPFSSTLT